MIPTYKDDLFSDYALLKPLEHYKKIRDLGPVVDLTASGVLAVGRYAETRALLLDNKRFISSKGVALNEATNVAAAGIPLTLDPPEHTRLRRVLDQPLTRQAVERLREQIEAEAERLISELTTKDVFDGVTDLAQKIPVSIVSTLVGLPEEGRESMLAWAAASHDVNGPPNFRTENGAKTFFGMIEYAATKVSANNVRSGSWAADLYKSAEAGKITDEEVTKLIISYVVPSLETTISTTAQMLEVFGQHPNQWNLLRRNPHLTENAVEEVLRFCSPVRSLARYANEDVEIGGVKIPQGRYVVALYASGNRDERKWNSPDEFDITRRNAKDHLAFGMGVHRCSGQYLAKLEIASILKAMVRHIESFDVGPATYTPNNILTTMSAMPVYLA